MAHRSDRRDRGDRGTSGERSSSRSRKTPKYTAVRVIGSGSFGVVYEAIITASSEKVAIKKVLEDRRYKNREFEIMKRVDHCNIVKLIDCFYSRGRRKSGASGSQEERYLNYVMDFVPETIYDSIRNHSQARQTIPYIYTKVYSYQICRSLAYCHAMGICHRDIKPQNLLLHPDTHTVKLCDFGSAKCLVEGEPNVAYICSRYYRAPELIFEQSKYTTSIDMWSIGCVVAELFLGTPLFQAQTSIDQLVEIFKVLGSPSRAEIIDMNPSYTQYRFPTVPPLPWEKVFERVEWNHTSVPEQAIDFLARLLMFSPQKRLGAFEALAHPWFDDLRDPEMTLPNGRPLPPLFNFSPEELALARKLGLYDRIVPPHVQSAMENAEH